MTTTSDGAIRLDDLGGLRNALTGMGMSQLDPTNYTTINRWIVALRQEDQESLTRMDGIIRKVCSNIPNAATAKWGSITVASKGASPAQEQLIGKFLAQSPEDSVKALLKNGLDNNDVALLHSLLVAITASEDIDPEILTDTLKQLLRKNELLFGQVLNSLLTDGKDPTIDALIAASIEESALFTALVDLVGKVSQQNEIVRLTDQLNKLPVLSPLQTFTGAQRGFQRAMQLAFATGNAALVIDTGESDLSQPIDEKSLKQIKSLWLFDRWGMKPDLTALYSASLKDRVKYYQIVMSSSSLLQLPANLYGTRVHESRVLWFRGTELSDYSLWNNEGCDDSVIQPILDAFKVYKSAVQGLGRLATDYEVTKIGMSGLLQRLEENTNAKSIIQERLAINSLRRSLYNDYIYDKELETIDHLTRNVSGYGDLIDRLKAHLLASTDYPPAVLFGEFSAGLDASGKETTEKALWNETIGGVQSQKMDDNIIKLVRYLCLCKDSPTKGQVPDGLDWAWQPLYAPTPEENAGVQTQFVALAQTLAGIDPTVALEAVRSFYSGSEFNPNITLSKQTLEYLERTIEQATVEQQPQDGEAPPEGEDFSFDEYEGDLAPDEEAPPEEPAPEEASPTEEVTDSADSDRLDARGQGVACGKGFIPPTKKCSPDKARTTSKEALAKTKENRKKLHALKAEVARDKGKRSTPLTEEDSFQRDLKKMRKDLASGKLVQNSKEYDSRIKVLTERRRNLEAQKKKADEGKEKADLIASSPDIAALSPKSKKVLTALPLGAVKNPQTIALMRAWETGRPIDPGGYIGESRVNNINPPSKKHPRGSISFTSIAGETFGKKDVYDLDFLLDNLRSGKGRFTEDSDQFDRFDDKYSGINFRPSPGTIKQAKRALKLIKDGKAGNGMEKGTIDWVRRVAKGEAFTPDKVIQGWKWHLRNGRFAKLPESSPGGVAWAAWFGKAGKADFNRMKAEIDRVDMQTKTDASKPCPGGYRIPLTKKCRSKEKLAEGVKGAAEHGLESVGSWTVGKIVGGAIGSVAAAHGFPPGLSNQIAESAVQALTATMLHARKKEHRSAGELANTFISQAVGAFAGKMVHTGWDDAILGGDEHVRELTAMLAGKGTGAATVASVSATLKRQANALKGLVDRTRKRGIRSDAVTGVSSGLSRDEQEALFDLTFAAGWLARQQQRSVVDSLEALLTETSDRLDADDIEVRWDDDNLEWRIDWGKRQSKLKPGDTKQQNGKTYVFNENRRWSLAEESRKGKGKGKSEDKKGKGKTETVDLPPRATKMLLSVKNEIAQKQQEEFFNKKPAPKPEPEQPKPEAKKPVAPPPPPAPAKQAPAKKRVTHTDLISAGDSLIPDDLKKDIEALTKDNFMPRYSKATVRLKELTQEMADAKEGKEGTRSLSEIVKEGRTVQKEYDTLKPKAQQLTAKMEKLRQSLIESSPISQEEANKLASKISIDSNASAVIPEKQLRSQASEFYRLTGGRGSTTIDDFTKDDDRAYANPDKRNVNIGNSKKKAIVFHEMAHHIEFGDDSIGAASVDWIRSRADGNVKKLKDLTGNPNYRDSEIAYPDKFVSPYVGKVYPYKGPDGKPKIKPATEVVSMGVERFASASAMAEFAVSDPEHFKFVLGAIRSKK